MFAPWLVAPAVCCLMVEPQTFVRPGYNKIVWAESANRGRRPMDTPVDTIVLHHTAGSLEGTVSWFATRRSKVSAHYTVGKDGSIVQHVSCFMRAWHAGTSVDAFEREDVNDFSIGIEMENKGDGNDPWPPVQVAAVHNLVAFLVRHRFPGVSQIISHEAIALPKGRKNDPRGFPWESLKDLNVKLVH